MGNEGEFLDIETLERKILELRDKENDMCRDDQLNVHLDLLEEYLGRCSDRLAGYGEAMELYKKVLEKNPSQHFAFIYAVVD